MLQMRLAGLNQPIFKALIFQFKTYLIVRFKITIPFARLGVGIGDQILDLSACAQAGLLSALPDSIVETLQQSTMNAFMSLNRAGVATNPDIISFPCW